MAAQVEDVATRPRVDAAIIGTGFMGAVHARAVARAGGGVARVLGSSPDRSRVSAGELRSTAASSLDEVLADERVDVVHVCTPNDTHEDIALAVIAAGKHVICEKPLATSRLSAERLAARASDAGVVATVPFVYRFYPMVRAARRRVRSGRPGPLHLIHGSYLQDWLSDPDAGDWRIDPARGGGSRAFGDIGVHWCDLVEFVTDHRITRLLASTLTAFPDRVPAGADGMLTEDAACLVFATDRGAIGSVVLSQVSPGRKNRLWLSLDGVDESLSFDQENPETLWVGGREVNQTLLRGSGEPVSRYSVLPPGHPQGYQDCFDAFVADTYAAIRGERPDGLPTFADGLRATVLTDAVLASARTGEWQDVGP
jgi:predicted dehydrogenase